MTGQNLLQAAKDVENKIKNASPAKRLALQPELSKALERLKADGQPVPLQLRQLETALGEEAIESWFDNLPV